MNTFDLVRKAITNSFRSLSRTTLTVVAIFIGAFTLTLTNGVGNGVNAYIDGTVSSMGASDVLTLTKTQGEAGDGPQKYDATRTVTSGDDGSDAASVQAINAADLAQLRTVDGVRSVEPVLSLDPDFIQYGDKQPYEVSIASLVPGTTLQLAAGTQPRSDTKEREVTLPIDYLAPLGFGDASVAIGKSVALAVTNANNLQSTIDARVVAVTEPGLAGGDTSNANAALARSLYDRQSVGLDAATENSYAQATPL